MERETSNVVGDAGWICGNPNDYDREYTVDLVQLLAFLIETQPDAFDGLNLSEDGPSRRKLLARLQGEISRRGVIDVLRKGIKDGLYRDDLDIEVITRFYVARIDATWDGRVFPPDQFNVKDVLWKHFEYHIRGIASKKGVDYLEKKVKKERAAA